MSKPKAVLIIILVLFLLWLSIYTFPFLSRLRLSVITLLKFPLSITNTTSSNVRDFVEAVLHSKWIEENMELKYKLSEFSYDITRLKELDEENKRLKNLLQFKMQSSNEVIPARVIGVDSTLFTRSIIIDRGIKDGLDIGSVVISIQGVVGKIVEANSDASRVMLLEDPDFRLGVINQRTREQGLFVGSPYGKARVIYLDPDSDTKEGDTIVSFSSDSMFPKGLLIGYVRHVQNENVSLYKSATVKIAVDYSRLEEVLCIK